MPIVLMQLGDSVEVHLMTTEWQNVPSCRVVESCGELGNDTFDL